jgi:hypothetical protein
VNDRQNCDTKVSTIYGHQSVLTINVRQSAIILIFYEHVTKLDLDRIKVLTSQE